jgi:hypothetical protein
VEVKTSFKNETSFFSNDSLNQYFNRDVATDDNYESLIEMYLNGGLDDEGSIIDSFNMFIYAQTIWPKQERSFLNQTRSRTFYVNTFWRDNRDLRTQMSVDTGYGVTVPSQSIWPLDTPADWETRGEPLEYDHGGSQISYGSYIGGSFGHRLAGVYYSAFNTGDDPSVPTYASSSAGASGILMNSYSTFTRGYYVNAIPTLGVNTSTHVEQISNTLSASCIYSRRHQNININSVVGPSGMDINETGSLTEIPLQNLFEGMAAWDAWKEKGKKPFYDSYKDFSEELKVKGKGYSIVPEFRISSHIETYQTRGITSELKEIFELSGALSQNSTTATDSTFYKVLSTSDFLKHFDMVQKDHKEFASEKIITLKCKAIKKFLPYEGFYPAQRTVELGQRFIDSFSNNFSMVLDGNSNVDIETSLKNLPVLEPLFAPGVLFNTIKSGVAVDFPIIIRDHSPENVSAGISGSQTDAELYNHYIQSSTEFQSFNTSITSLIDFVEALNTSNEKPWSSVFSERIPFEALVEPEKYLSDIDLRLQEPHPFGLSDIDASTSWDGQGDNLYQKMSNNFLAEVVEFFMKDSNLTTLSSLEEQNPEFGNAVSGNFYVMRIKMKRSRNQKNDFIGGIGGTKVIPPQDNYARVGVKENFTMYSRPSSFGPAVWGTSHSGTIWGSYETSPMGDQNGNNYCYTPPYYYGEAWCDVIFECTASKKYTLDEILSEVQEYPYYTRYWWGGVNDALRDMTGYQTDISYSTPINSNSKYFKYKYSPWNKLFNQTSIGFVSGGIPSGFDFSDYNISTLNWSDNTDPKVNNYPI